MPEDRSAVVRLEQIPNIGKAGAADFRILGIHTPQEIVGRDPYELYAQLCQITAKRHDPCVIDVLISATRYMSGEPATPWWTYTAERKATIASRTKAQG